MNELVKYGLNVATGILRTMEIFTTVNNNMFYLYNAGNSQEVAWEESFMDRGAASRGIGCNNWWDASQHNLNAIKHT